MKKNKQVDSRIAYMQSVMQMKDKFCKTRHQEKSTFAGERNDERNQMMNLRFELALKLLDHRDIFAGKRHKERLELLMKRYGK